MLAFVEENHIKKVSGIISAPRSSSDPRQVIAAVIPFRHVCSFHVGKQLQRQLRLQLDCGLDDLLDIYDICVYCEEYHEAVSLLRLRSDIPN